MDTDRLVVTRLSRRNSAGEVEVEMEAGDFREFGGFTLARQIRLEFPGRGRALSVYYTSLEPNGEAPSFAFTIPPSARTRQP